LRNRRAGVSPLLLADFRRYVLGTVLLFGALNAFAGGYYGLAGAEGVPLEWLRGSPFSDYTIPSAILFVVVGGSLLIAGVLLFRDAPGARLSALAAGVVVLVWITTQLVIIGYVSWMQPATFAGGLLVVALALPVRTPTTDVREENDDDQRAE
jgi:hypothetical protein